MKMAIIHPWFLERGGGEKVAALLASIYPEADILSLCVDPAMLPTELHNRIIRTPRLNTLLASRLHLKRTYFMPFLPQLIKAMDVKSYDVILSSSPPLMGLNTRPDAVHICYCHTPERIWWDQSEYHRNRLPPIVAPMFKWFTDFIRKQELSSVPRVDQFISNSQYVAQRVLKYFGRQSIVIYPPVKTSTGYIGTRQDDYYISLGRLERSKRIELLIEACNRLHRKLIIVGSGSEERALRSIAGSTIEFAGVVPDSGLAPLLASCRAMLFAADEDFGISMVEAQSYGRPVIAYGHGGALEAVRVADPAGRPDTGVFFSNQTIESVADGILRFETLEKSFDSAAIRAHACQFDTAVFIKRIREIITETINSKSF